MSNFEKWKDRYNRNWVTKEQLNTLVTLSVLTAEEVAEIVGDNNE